MLALPLKQYNVLARTLAKKRITVDSITAQLKASNGFMIVNGIKVKISLARLTNIMSTINNTAINITAVRPQVLERAYKQLKKEQFI